MSSDKRPAAGEIVALLRAGVIGLQTWPYDAVPTETTISSLCKLLNLGADSLDSSRAETDAAKRERDEALRMRNEFRDVAMANKANSERLDREVEIWQEAAGEAAVRAERNEDSADAANARAEALERERDTVQVALDDEWLKTSVQEQRAEAAEAKLAETAAELVRVRAKLAKIAEFVKGRQHDDDAWGHGAAAEDEAILAEIEEGKSP